jgi:hypothetical protein
MFSVDRVITIPALAPDDFEISRARDWLEALCLCCPSGHEDETLFFEMRVEAEGFVQPPFPHHDEGRCIDQAQPSLPSLDEKIEGGFVNGFVYPGNLAQRNEVGPKRLDGC